jgi:hypothetical protein
LKEYWGVKNGINQHRRVSQNAQPKTTEDIAETINESIHQTRRLLKLNDLIPEIQALVSAGRLGTTAAEQLAYLTEDEQRVLFGDRGQGLSEITVADAKALRRSQRAAFRELVEKVRAEARERKLSTLKRGAESPDRPDLAERGLTSAALAEKVGIGKSSMKYLMAVQRDAPDLFQRVKAGEMSDPSNWSERGKSVILPDLGGS